VLLFPPTKSVKVGQPWFSSPPLILLLEVVLQAELHGAGTMRVHGMQEGAALQATGVARRIIGATVAGDGVAAGIALVRIVDAELGMVEDVECFRTKFEIAALGDFEMLQESNIKVQTVGIVHEIAASVSESQTDGSAECGWIAEDRADTLRVIRSKWSRSARISNYIRVRSGARPVGDAGVVEHGDASAAAAVNDAERRARLKNCDSGQLPSVLHSADPSR
jgi:hypothetical protein